MEQLHQDAARIDAFGGPTKVAERLGIAEEPGAVQRVSNWKRRGIPSSVLLTHEWLRAPAPALQETSHVGQLP
ncbi:hypothetical protein A7J67_08425 [Achromobacter xylosoxidans]|nr:hypothetical protein A7J67_08425 [Achromobacter xylosoxidans]